MADTIVKGNTSLECPNCHRRNIRHRIKTHDTACNLCGHVWPDEPIQTGSTQVAAPDAPGMPVTQAPADPQ